MYFIFSEGAKNITLQNIKIIEIIFIPNSEQDFVQIKAAQNEIILNNIIFKNNSFYNCSIFILEKCDLLINHLEILDTLFESQCEKNSYIFLSLHSNLIFYKLFLINNIFSGNIKILYANGNGMNNLTLSLFYAHNVIFKKQIDDSAIFYFDSYLRIFFHQIFFSKIDSETLNVFLILNTSEISIKDGLIKNLASSYLVKMEDVKYIEIFSLYIAELISLLNDNNKNDAIIFIRNSLNFILENITFCSSTINLSYLDIMIDSTENATYVIKNQNFVNNKMITTKNEVMTSSMNFFFHFNFSKSEITSKIMNLTNFLIFNNSVYNEDENDSESPFIFVNLNFLDQLYLLNYSFLENFSNCDSILIKLMGENFQMFDSNFIDNQVFNDKYLMNIFLSSKSFLFNNLNIQKNFVGTNSLIHIENSSNNVFILGMFEELTVSNNTSFYSLMNFHFNLEEFKIEILNSTFDFNYCLSNGGVIKTSYFDYNSILIVFNCTFKNNIASYFGGVFYLANLGNNIVINKTNFINNSIKKDGGGVFCVYGDPDTKITLKNCYFERNYSPKKGGVYLILTGSIYDETSIYKNNFASEGGVFAISFFSILMLRNCTNQGSNASLNSGFLKMMGQSEVNIIDSKIYYSFAPRGGVVVSGGMTLLIIKNSTFFANSADNASFLYAVNSAFIILIEDSVFMENYGIQNLFEIISSSISLSNCILKNNSINIFMVEFTYLIMNSTIIENNICKEVKKKSGCLIYIISKSFLMIAKLFASKIWSKSDENGIIYSSDSNLKISYSYFEKWKQNLSGSSFYATSSNFSLQCVLIFDYDNRVFSLIGSTFVFENSSIVQNVEKGMNSKNLKGSISCLQCINFQILWSLIKGTNNFEEKGGAIQLIESNGNSIFQIKNSNISENYGKKGGGLYVENLSINIVNTNFTKNLAESGGAIYFTCNYNRFCTFNLSGNYFSENRVNLSGGAIKWFSNVPIIEENNIFYKNEGLYGVNISSQPVRLISVDPSLFSQFLEFQSGNVSSLFEFYIVDFYGQKIKNETGFGFITTNENNEKNVVQIKTDKISFNKIKVIGTPNFYAILRISTSIIASYFDQLIFSSQDSFFQDSFDESTHIYYLALKVTFRDCLIGEIYIPYKNICQECPFHYFSLNKNDSVCQICPENAICEGGNKIFVLPSFWRKNTNSSKIYTCINSNACLGGFNSTCLYGYTGPLCDVCLIDDKNKYYKFGQGVCENCEDMNIIGLIMLLLFSSSWGFYLVFTIKKNIQLSNKTNDFSEDVPILLKIGADYFQIVSSVFLLDLAFPVNFSYIFQVIEQTISLSSILFPLECILADYSTFLNIFFLKLFLGSFVAWTILFISIFFWLVYICIKKRAFKYFKTEIIITIIIVGFNLQSPLISLYFTAMNCVEINQVKYLKKQLILECWESEHLQIFFGFIFPSILLWAILLPFICWIYVSKNINSSNRQTKASLVFITEGIRKEYYYWEFLLMTKRLLINIFTVFFESGDEILCVSIILLILYFFSIFFFNSHPYKNKNLNTIYAISIYSTDVIYIFSLLCLIMKNQINSSIFLIIIFFGFILFIWKFVSYYYFASKQNLQKLVKRLAQIKIMGKSQILNLFGHLTNKIHILFSRRRKKEI